MFEKYPKGQKDFSTILQKARVRRRGAGAPYEGDLISMTRQMKQLDINFPYVFMVYATPQFQAIGADADYIYSHQLPSRDQLEGQRRPDARAIRHVL